jgi:hypothetical protein
MMADDPGECQRKDADADLFPTGNENDQDERA